MSSIRKQIFDNNTTLFGILDAEGVTENNERFSEIESQTSTLAEQQDQTFKQLVQLSKIVDRNWKDFNEFEVVTKTDLEALDIRVDVLNGNLTTLTSTTNRLTTDVTAINNEINTIRLNVAKNFREIQELTSELEDVKADVRILQAAVVKNSRDILNLGSIYINTNSDLQFFIPYDSITIRWRTIQSSIISNTRYAVEFRRSTTGEGNWIQANMTIIAPWDTFQAISAHQYRILNGPASIRLEHGLFVTDYDGSILNVGNNN